MFYINSKGTGIFTSDFFAIAHKSIITIITFNKYNKGHNIIPAIHPIIGIMKDKEINVSKISKFKNAFAML